MIKSFQQFINESLRRASVADDKKIYTCVYELINKAILAPVYIEEFRSSFANASRRNFESYLFEIDSNAAYNDTYSGLDDMQFTPIDENTIVSVTITDGWNGEKYELNTRVNIALLNGVNITFSIIDYADEYDEPFEEPGGTYVEIDLSKAPHADLDETIELLKTLSSEAFAFVK